MQRPRFTVIGLTLLVLDFQVHPGIGGGHNVPTDFETC